MYRCRLYKTFQLPAHANNQSCKTNSVFNHALRTTWRVRLATKKHLCKSGGILAQFKLSPNLVLYSRQVNRNYIYRYIGCTIAVLQFNTYRTSAIANSKFRAGATIIIGYFRRTQWSLQRHLLVTDSLRLMYMYTGSIFSVLGRLSTLAPRRPVGFAWRIDGILISVAIYGGTHFLTRATILLTLRSITFTQNIVLQLPRQLCWVDTRVLTAR